MFGIELGADDGAAKDGALLGNGTGVVVLGSAAVL